MFKGKLVDENLATIRFDHHSEDFLLYILKNKANIPHRFFNKEDCRVLNKFIINKTLYSSIRFFPQAWLFPEEFLDECMLFQRHIRSHINLKIDKELFTFGFKHLVPFSDSSDMGALANSYGLKEFVDQVMGGIIIDCGPFIGDSTFVFRKLFPNSKIACLEPDEINRAKLLNSIKFNQINNIDILPYGAGNENISIPVSNYGSAGSSVVSNPKYSAKQFDVKRIDDLFLDKSERLSLMKMDIEGFELEALMGAKEIIKRDNPVLVIAAYHRGRDIFEIPNFISEINSNYSFHFRHLDPRFPCSEYVIVATNRTNF